MTCLVLISFAGVMIFLNKACFLSLFFSFCIFASLPDICQHLWVRRNLYPILCHCAWEGENPFPCTITNKIHCSPSHFLCSVLKSKMRGLPHGEYLVLDLSKYNTVYKFSFWMSSQKLWRGASKNVKSKKPHSLHLQNIWPTVWN